MKAPIAPTGGGEQATEKPAAVPAGKSTDNAARSQIVISGEIRQACGLTDEDAYFAFDSAHVDSRDETILAEVAR